MLAMTTPRPHHFEFAHVALPEFAFGDRKQFLDALANDANGFVNALWQHVGQLLVHHGEAALELDRPLTVEHREAGGLSYYVVRMPEPIAAPEAWFAIIVLVTDSADSVAVYTVDRGFEPPLLQRRIWPDARSIIQGYFGAPTLDGFLASITDDVRSATDVGAR